MVPDLVNKVEEDIMCCFDEPVFPLDGSQHHFSQIVVTSQRASRAASENDKRVA